MKAKVSGLELFSVLAALVLLIPAPAPSPAGFDAGAFARLPVLDEGRLKPVETVARAALLELHGRETIACSGRTLSAVPWLLDALARPEEADRCPLFVIDDPGLLGLMGKPQASRRYFSLQELGPGMMDVVANAQRAQALEPSRRSDFDSAAINLVERVELYQKLKSPQGLAAGVAPEDLPAYVELLLAWRAGDAARFNAAAAKALEAARARDPAGDRRAAWEALFDRAEPFTRGMIAYLAALLLLLLSRLPGREKLRRAAFAAAAAGLIVHTAGLAARMALQGRPPVTNLYSSAVFVGWTAAAAGLWLERRFQDGLGLLCACVVGFSTLIIAHHLAAQGDTMEMMRAVLDSNFWLTTHVVTITLGYGAMFLAAALAHVHVARRFWQPERPADRSLSSMIYGVTCLALFFSFLGTVLGGIWADQSWGRFWGWDPKENGALLIVLWDAVVLHARWGGYLREDGLAVMAVFGGVVTSLSWFGVNMLGIGLHSYGFMQQAAPWLERFVFVELTVMAAGAFVSRGRAARAG